MFDEVLTRLDAIELAGPITWLPSTFINGPRRMPVRFVARSARPPA
jgi:cytochrome P450